jgi:hypothetical protein
MDAQGGAFLDPDLYVMVGSQGVCFQNQLCRSLLTLVRPVRAADVSAGFMMYGIALQRQRLVGGAASWWVGPNLCLPRVKCTAAQRQTVANSDASISAGSLAAGRAVGAMHSVMDDQASVATDAFCGCSRHSVASVVAIVQARAPQQSLSGGPFQGCYRLVAALVVWWA